VEVANQFLPKESTMKESLQKRALPKRREYGQLGNSPATLLSMDSARRIGKKSQEIRIKTNDKGGQEAGS